MTLPNNVWLGAIIVIISCSASAIPHIYIPAVGKWLGEPVLEVGGFVGNLEPNNDGIVVGSEVIEITGDGTKVGDTDMAVMGGDVG